MHWEEEESEVLNLMLKSAIANYQDMSLEGSAKKWSRNGCLERVEQTKYQPRTRLHQAEAPRGLHQGEALGVKAAEQEDRTTSNHTKVHFWLHMWCSCVRLRMLSLHTTHNTIATMAQQLIACNSHREHLSVERMMERVAPIDHFLLHPPSKSLSFPGTILYAWKYKWWFS